MDDAPVATAPADPPPQAAAPSEDLPPAPDAASPADSPPPAAPPLPAPRLGAPPNAAPGMVPAMGPSYPDEEIEDYRWEIVAADAVSLALLLKGGRDGSTVGALTYVLVPPILHLSEDRAGRAAASLVLRLGLPIAGALTGASLGGRGCHSEDDCDDEGAFVLAFLGFGAGLLSAMVVDTAFIARPIHKHSSVTWAPHVAVTRQQVRLGVAGRF